MESDRATKPDICTADASLAVTPVSRRRFLHATGAFGVIAALDRIAPAYARPNARLTPAPLARSTTDQSVVNLLVRETSIGIGNRRATATAFNGTVPGPLLRFREGSEAVIHVTNQLAEDTSIHWHGVIVPNPMDGVPGVNFPGIRAGETFSYRFPIQQYGTYWYHSHSGLQEQTGHYGPLIIDPAEPEPFPFDREYVVMLSDWPWEDPYRILDKLKKKADYYNFQRRTVGDFFGDISRRGWRATIQDRLMWGRMRMSPVDISDVTGAVYTYLMNGRPPESNWTGRFHPGERVRLRFINAGAGTYFDVRIPGLPMTVVAVSGQWVQPVETDELRIEIAQTYDVIVTPKEDQAYTIFAESVDRSGYARGTLAPRDGMTAPVPRRRPRPVLTMADMGMPMAAHGGTDMGNDMGNMDMPIMDFLRATPVTVGARADTSHADMPGMDMPGHKMPAKDKKGPDGAKPDTAHANMPGMKMPNTEKKGADTTRSRMPDMPGMTGKSDAPMPARSGGRRLRDGSVVYTSGLRPPGTLAETVEHGPDKHGVGNAATPMITRSRLGEPGPGLGADGWRVLVYTDLRALKPRPNALRPPTREIEMHLTGNMERFMWSINGIKFSEAREPIPIARGDRVRITMVNDTMMSHPMHIHGMWMELENGTGADIPRLHTVDVKPADRVSFLTTPDDLGPWAFHCHVLYHMEVGMFRVVSVSEGTTAEAAG